MASAIDAAVLAELEATAGVEFVRELVATFLAEAPAMLAELRDALDAGDADRFRRSAHSLKSNAYTFGARTLGEKARALELGGIAAARADGALAALEAEYRQAADALTELAHD
jgi:HPt (histidine-containing phosphotransfer) domain-containing protein